MANIYVPQQQQQQVSGGQQGGGKIGQILGTLGGGALGYAATAALNPAAGLGALAMGAMGGANAGGALGGLLGEAVKPTKQQEVTAPEPAPAYVQSNGSAMSRRLDDIQKTPLFALQEAKAAMGYAPKAIRQQYEPVIDESLALAIKQRRAAEGIA